MKTVRAGLDHYVDDAALVVAELSRRVIGDELELLDGVDVGLIGRQIIRYLVVIHAIEEKIVRLLAIAVHVGTASARGANTAVEAVRIGRGHPGSKQRQGDGVTADERRVYNGLRRNDRADLRGFGLQNGRVSAHRYALRDRAHLHRQIDTGPLVDLQLNVGLRGGFEAGGFHPQFVVANRNARKRIDAVLVGFGRPFRAAVPLLRSHRGSYNRPTSGIGDFACDAGAHLLRHDRQGAYNHRRKK